MARDDRLKMNVDRISEKVIGGDRLVDEDFLVLEEKAEPISWVSWPITSENGSIPKKW